MSPRVRLVVALFSTSLCAYVLLGNVLGRVLGDTTYGQLSVFNEVTRLVIDAYVDPVNVDRVMAGARLGLTDALDPESGYLDADEWKAYQQPARDADADVGIVLSRRFTYLAVVAPRPGSPADKAGIRSGDILKTIDGRYARGLSIFAGERLLRGAPGSVLKLQLYRQGNDPIDVSVTRERILAGSPTNKMLDGGPGYLKIAEFSAKTADEVRDEIEALKRSGARSLVLDLRDSAFGSPADGVDTAALFLKGGIVGKLVGRKYPEKTLAADPKRFAWDLPLAVLVDSGTAGPAEVVAAALLDAGKPVIGQHTFGRAPITKLVPLQDGGLVLTIAKYVSPKGNPIHGKGIEPSVPVKDAASADDEEEESAAPPRDRTLEKAIEILKAAPEAKKAA
jgi:carboxyl-terminal processing protease